MSEAKTDFAGYQARLVASYQNGAPGVAVSGIVWLAAAFTAAKLGVPAGFTVLFFGGMAIFPLGLAISRLLFKAPASAAGNPLERTALESTAGLFVGLAAGFLLLPVAPNAAFPVVAMAIGARYFLFRSVYGDAGYWVLGAGIAGVGIAAAFMGLLSGPMVPLAVGLVELVGAVWLYVRWRARP